MHIPISKTLNLDQNYTTQKHSRKSGKNLHGCSFVCEKYFFYI